MSYMIHAPTDKKFCPYCGRPLELMKLLCEHLESTGNELWVRPVEKECDYYICKNTFDCIQGPKIIKSLA